MIFILRDTFIRPKLRISSRMRNVFLLSIFHNLTSELTPPSSTSPILIQMVKGFRGGQRTGSRMIERRAWSEKRGVKCCSLCPLPSALCLVYEFSAVYLLQHLFPYSSRQTHIPLAILPFDLLTSISYSCSFECMSLLSALT